MMKKLLQKNKKPSRWGLLCVVQLFAFSAVAQTLSLQECVATAIKKHPDFAQAQLLAEQASANVAITKSNLYPNMAFGLNQSTNTGRSIDVFTNSYISQVYNNTNFQLSLQQPIFRGFQVKNQLAADNLTLDASLQQMEAAKNNLKVRVIQAYLSVLQAEELVQVADTQIKATEEQLNKLKLQLAAGTIGQKDVLQLEGQLSNEKFSKIQNTGQVKIARLNLFQLMNVNPDDYIQFEKLSAMAPVSLTADSLNFLQNLPEIKAANLLVDSYDNRLKAIRGQKLPSVSFSAFLTTFYASSNPKENFVEQLNATRNGTFALGVQVPILARLQVAPREQEVRVQKRLEENRLQATELQLKQNYFSALQRYELAAESYQNAQEQVRINENFLALVQQQMSVGTVNILDYIVAKKNYESARSAEVQQKYGLAMQSKIVEFYKTGDWEL